MRPLMPPVQTPDNLFHDGNPLTGELGTIVDAEHLNNVQGAVRDAQSELITVLNAAGINVDPSKQNQLLTALKALLLSRSNPFGDIKSDGTVKTALENLQLGEAAKMPAASMVITGNTLTAKIPVIAAGALRDLIIHASQVSSSSSSGTITFPSAFPNACIMIIPHDFATAASDLSNIRFYMPGKSSAAWYGQNMSTGNETPPATWGWFAIGW